jgi:hypothetical protein
LEVDPSASYIAAMTFRSDTPQVSAALESILSCYDEDDHLIGHVIWLTPCCTGGWSSTARPLGASDWPASTARVRLGIAPKVWVEDQTAVNYLDMVQFYRFSLEELRAQYPDTTIYVVSDPWRILDGKAEVVFSEGDVVIYKIRAD